MIFVASVIAIGLAVVALAVSVITEPESLTRAWLTAWTVLSGPSIGALFVGLTAVLAPGPWVEKIRAPIKAMLLALPVLSLGALPILFSLGALYPWIDPGEEIAHFVDPRGAWQEPLWFALRQVLWLAILSGAALVLATGRLTSRPLAGIAAIPVTFAASFLALDMSMSLDAAFNSTIFGLYVVAGQAAAALGIAIVVQVLITRDPERVAGRPVWLLFGACALWGYHAFFQYLIIWTGDLPRNAGWYLERNQDLWLAAIALYCLGFALGFLLLYRPIRKSVGGLVVVPGGVALGYAVEAVWRTAADLDPNPIYWTALFGWLGLAAGLCGLTLARIKRREAARA